MLVIQYTYSGNNNKYTTIYIVFRCGECTPLAVYELHMGLCTSQFIVNYSLCCILSNMEYIFM